MQAGAGADFDGVQAEEGVARGGDVAAESAGGAAHAAAPAAHAAAIAAAACWAVYGSAVAPVASSHRQGVMDMCQTLHFCGA
jgi:hypothetical protein